MEGIIIYKHINISVSLLPIAYTSSFVILSTIMYRSVVEIGSGCGFLGLVVSNVTGPSSYTFTDCHEDVLAVLQENIRINSKN